LREEIKSERARITELMITDAKSSKASGKGDDLRKPSEAIRSHYHCDTLTEENR
jgi:hypothetical protein